MLPEGLEVSHVKRVSSNELSSACPQCGGAPHANGELPDRFRIFLKSSAYGGPLGWCRKCGYIWTPKKSFIQDPIKQAAWKQEQEAIENQIRARAEYARDVFTSDKPWIRYHDNLTDDIKEHYYKRNIPDFFIDYWMLGYNPEKHYWVDDQEYISPALTIPIIQLGGEVINIRSRLLAPEAAGDKYRPERKGLPSSLYYTDYDNPITNSCLMVEGEFKAMTVYLALDDPKISVVGLPGKSPLEQILEPLAGCERVYICLDPDAMIKPKQGGKSAIRRMIEHFGKRARVITLPEKIDDMIAQDQLGKRDIINLLKMARKYNIN